MNILLVYPKCPDTFWSFKHALKFVSKKAMHPPLGLLTVAAMLPENWHKRLVDMNIDPLREKDLQWADYVFISAMTIQKESVFKIVSTCRQRGIKIVAGGPLFTSEPELFPDIDHMVLNEAETTLPAFLEDFKNNSAEHIYSTDTFPTLDKTPVPLWHLPKMHRYASMNIQFSRGCPFDCEFCDIAVLNGTKVRTKATHQVMSELNRLYASGWRGNVFFVDDNFIGNKTRLKNDLLPTLIEWMEARKYPFAFSTEASINLSDDEKLMDLMVRAGFDGVFIGIETPDEKSLAECNKNQNRNRDLMSDIKKIQRHGLDVRGGFIVGFDHDSPSIFPRQINFIQKSGIITAMVGLLNAPTGTRLYQRMSSQGRILTGTSGDNTNFTTNIIPKMGYETLLNGYKRIISGIYSPKPYYTRVKKFLKEYAPTEKRTFHFHMGYVRFHSGYPMAFIKSVFLLGIKDQARVYFWKLLFWSLFRRPKYLPMAITYAIYGFHFRKVFEDAL